jgi:hypothetical protein
MSSYARTATGPDDAIAHVEQQIAAAREQAERARGFQDEVTAARGSAESPRGHVRVTVDASGRLAEVTLSARAYELAPQQLGRLIVETSRAAQRAAGERVLRLAAETFGSDSGVVERLRAELDALAPARRSGRGLA